MDRVVTPQQRRRDVRIAVEEHARDTAMQQAFAVLGVGAGLADVDGRLVDANDALLDVLGLSRADVVGRTLPDVISGLGGNGVAVGGSDGRTEHAFTRTDGRRTWVRVTVSEVTGRNGGVLLRTHAVEDVTEHRARERLLRERALLDPVTGLANRYLLEDRLDHALAQRSRGGGEVAVLFVDVDGFKRVNDSAGHAAGDTVLRELGQRLRSCARAVDTVARWAGDEFVVLCEGLSDARDADLVVERIDIACSVPFRVAGHSFELGASVGLAMTGHLLPDTAEALLERADLRMYEQKATRRGSR